MKTNPPSTQTLVPCASVSAAGLSQLEPAPASVGPPKRFPTSLVARTSGAASTTATATITRAIEARFAAPTTPPPGRRDGGCEPGQDQHARTCPPCPGPLRTGRCRLAAAVVEHHELGLGARLVAGLILHRDLEHVLAVARGCHVKASGPAHEILLAQGLGLAGRLVELAQLPAVAQLVGRRAVIRALERHELGARVDDLGWLFGQRDGRWYRVDHEAVPDWRRVLVVVEVDRHHLELVRAVGGRGVGCMREAGLAPRATVHARTKPQQAARGLIVAAAEQEPGQARMRERGRRLGETGLRGRTVWLRC